MSTTRTRRWTDDRRKELAALTELLSTVASLNFGPNFFERVKRCEQLAKMLNTPDLETPRPDFHGFLCDLCRRDQTMESISDTGCNDPGKRPPRTPNTDFAFVGDPATGVPPQVSTLAEALEFARQQERLIQDIERENNHLRAALANGKGDCIYCNLPATEWSRCPRGFPGCARADDTMCGPMDLSDLGDVGDVDFDFPSPGDTSKNS